MIKKLLLLAIMLSAGFNPASRASGQVAPEYFVIVDDIMMVTPTDYMSAYNVRVDLLNGNGNVQATAYTQPGGTVSLQMNDATRTLRSTYYIDNFVIIVDEPPN